MGAMLVRHEATSASAVRRELALDLDLHGVDDELGVNWTIGPSALLISVEDPSDELPVLRHVGPEAPSGRGLSIIQALSATWGVERTRLGKRVWAKVELRRSA